MRASFGTTASSLGLAVLWLPCKAEAPLVARATARRHRGSHDSAAIVEPLPRRSMEAGCRGGSEDRDDEEL